MSSPAGVPQGLGPWQRTPPPGPPIAPVPASTEDGISIRPMRLKVLYTFDDQNRTNCLARWPHVLQIQTVAMDETTSIGVIELKTCIQAIVQCSPELVARLGQDYNIYAYDFSEYENPLVGQGLLSWILGAVSPTPITPANESRQLITGRVCKNILGIFANGVKETLEVKLRLVPVPMAVQTEYCNTMEKQRELNKALPTNFDAREWSNFAQSIQMASNATPPHFTNTNQRDGMSMEVVNQLLSPSLQQQSMMDQYNQGNINTESLGGVNIQENTKKTPSRPSSRTSVKRPRGRKAKSIMAAGGNTSGYEEGTDGDEGPAPKKKRARVTKANQHNSNSAFSTAPESLRVAASTAGSLRTFRPIAMSPNPTAAASSHLQDVPRAPTPIPNLPNQHIARDRAPSQSSLRRDSFAYQMQGSQRPHVSPYPQLDGPEDQVRDSIESANPSPERNFSPVDTPPEIASSPPVMRTRPVSRTGSSPACPSSPVLPQMPRTDSGFMSGSLEDLFGEDNVVPDEEAVEYTRNGTQPQNHAEFMIEEERPGPMELLPTRMPINNTPTVSGSAARSAISRAGSVMSEDGQVLPPLKKGGRAPSRRATPVQRNTPQQPQPLQALESFPPHVNRPPSDARNSASQPPEAQIIAPAPPVPGSRPSSRMMVRTASLGLLTLPEVPASDPVLPPSSLQRSQTWSEASHPVSEFPISMPSMDRFGEQPYSRTSNAKKEAVRQKLEDAIAKGQMPPFCANCGAIETPTWRKAYSQTVEGQPGYYEYSDKPGKVTAIVILDKDAEGKPTSYRLIKKSLLPEERQGDFEDFLLCNPCGIWMSKYKAQRPPDKWESNGPQERSRGGDKKKAAQRAPKPKKQQGQNAMPTSEANFTPSDANVPQSEAYFPQVDATSPADTTASMRRQQHQPALGPPAPKPFQRDNSNRPPKRLNAMTSDAASAALRRAIQSSPARWAGTQHSPIDVEEDLGETRRLLFPSPRKDGSPKVLGEVVTNVVTIAADFRSPKEAMVEAQNKENCRPAVDENDVDAELLKLFEEEMAKEDVPRPITPVQKSPATNPFKTPTRPTPSHRPITRSVSRSQRSGKSPGQLLTFNKTPSRTPRSVRRSPRHHDSVFESPFTATLNQLMSEANNQTSPARHNMELDFGSLPDLPNIGDHPNMDMNFSLEDFFSTDVPMPSSPPRIFHLYEDNIAISSVNMNSVNWGEFGEFGEFATKDLEGGDEVVVKTEPEVSPMKLGKGNSAGKKSTA